MGTYVTYSQNNQHNTTVKLLLNIYKKIWYIYFVVELS